MEGRPRARCADSAKGCGDGESGCAQRRVRFGMPVRPSGNDGSGGREPVVRLVSARCRPCGRRGPCSTCPALASTPRPVPSSLGPKPAAAAEHRVPAASRYVLIRVSRGPVRGSLFTHPSDRRMRGDSVGMGRPSPFPRAPSPVIRVAGSGSPCPL